MRPTNRQPKNINEFLGDPQANNAKRQSRTFSEKHTVRKSHTTKFCNLSKNQVSDYPEDPYPEYN